MTKVWFPAFGALVVGAAVAACGSSEDPQVNDGTCTDVQVDPLKEITIVDESVTSDPRTSNANNGVWSFRHAIEGMLPAGMDATTFITNWLDEWRNTTEFNGFQTDLESRKAGMEKALICPWLQQTPANECDATCSTCKARVFDLAKAPFRLIAIVNRPDLGGRPGIYSPAGESRLVFGLTAGPADGNTAKGLAMTLIAEYVAPAAPEEWFAAWHHLGTHATIDEAYKAELAALTERFVGRGTSPERPNGSSISQIRTSESAFNWIWQQREFNVDNVGLHMAPLDNTPPQPLNNSPLLAKWVEENREDILADRHVIPKHLLGGTANVLIYSWTVPGVDTPARNAFAKGTCNGCHTENVAVDGAFHISPYRSGAAKLSSFVFNPSDPGKDEVSLRTRAMKKVLCNAR